MIELEVIMNNNYSYVLKLKLTARYLGFVVNNLQALQEVLKNSNNLDSDETKLKE